MEILQTQLDALAEYLTSRQDEILASWRTDVDSDPEVSKVPRRTQADFYDHMPEVMRALIASVRAAHIRDKETSDLGIVKTDADSAHGLHRWQQSYYLREVVLEWGHIYLCLVDVLETYQLEHPDVEPRTMSLARRGLAVFLRQAVADSTSQYDRLKQKEAEGRLHDLKQIILHLNDMERQRGELLRQTSHDLRGELNTITMVTSALELEELSEDIRTEMVLPLLSSVSSLQGMLTGLMDLARLEAGQEHREIARFNAGELLAQLADVSQPLARERHLELHAEGPGTLMVQGDANKVRRIAQNLLLNALKYTLQGRVSLTWREKDAEYWCLCVQDTGPGLQTSSAAPLVSELQEATQVSREVGGENANRDVNVTGPNPSADVAPSGLTAHQQIQSHGEGIGLAIVKRLCDMLDAGLELDSQPGNGSTFTVILPCRYDAL